MMSDSPRSLLQSQTADLSIELLLAEHDTGYNSESPTSEETIESMNENLAFHNNGYRKINKLCDTLQGELYKAIKLDNNHHHNIHHHHHHNTLHHHPHHNNNNL
eukprot:583643_1